MIFVERNFTASPMYHDTTCLVGNHKDRIPLFVDMFLGLTLTFVAIEDRVRTILCAVYTAVCTSIRVPHVAAKFCNSISVHLHRSWWTISTSPKISVCCNTHFIRLYTRKFFAVCPKFRILALFCEFSNRCQLRIFWRFSRNQGGLFGITYFPIEGWRWFWRWFWRW